MQLSELVRSQIDADERRGFPVKFDNDEDRHNQLMRDLVGLVSEVGEFADCLKRVGLASSNPGYMGHSMTDATPQLRSELADISIYVFRLMTILDGDLEGEILRKMEVNRKRYQYLER